MPRFRRKPSHRRNPKLTASWLVTGPTIATEIKYDRRSIHLLPVKPNHHRRRFHEAQRLSVRAYVGGPSECHVTVTTAERIQLRDVDYPLARELGHIRVDEFRKAWVAEHDQFEGDLLERFEARHAHREVWVIRFDLDRMLPNRFLAQNSEEGYTVSAARGLKDEPPALHAHEWKDHVEANRDLTHDQWVALGRLVELGQRAHAHSVRGRNMRKRAA